MNIMTVGSLAGPRDMFRCVPYGATMQAGSCLLRQANARRAWKPGDTSDAKKSKCADCALGREVSERLSTRTATTSTTANADPEPPSAPPAPLPHRGSDVSTATASKPVKPPSALPADGGLAAWASHRPDPTPTPDAKPTATAAATPPAPPVVHRHIKPATATKTTTATTVEATVTCKWKGCKADVGMIKLHGARVTPLELRLFCAEHRVKLRGSPTRRAEYGLGGLGTPSEKPKSGVRHEPAKAAAKRIIASSAKSMRPSPKPAKVAKTTKPLTASQPSTIAIRINSVEIEGENVSLEQLAGLWSAVRNALGAGA